jgi:hypothetical protein
VASEHKYFPREKSRARTEVWRPRHISKQLVIATKSIIPEQTAPFCTNPRPGLPPLPVPSCPLSPSPVNQAVCSSLRLQLAQQLALHQPVCLRAAPLGRGCRRTPDLRAQNWGKSRLARPQSVSLLAGGPPSVGLGTQDSLSQEGNGYGAGRDGSLPRRGSLGS